MSTTVDQRVVEMRFDNKQFEQNVSTTMSTLDKLKQSLNFTGASKGLDNLNTAVGNVNMSGFGSSVEAVSAKFSALQVMGVTALANITNSAVNAGKRIVSALTIDPIKTGFSEYETQINATQTILANTQNKGSTIDDVNRALEELNKYADLTIYNFTEMTRNIGTFTAAGIDLDTSVNAIQGIANLAAVSGSTSQQASTAMYQLSQALASGTVKLMDWNSVVNAGMGGEMFQNALKETSKLLGTGAEAAIEAQGSFRESLKTGWLTSEVLTETLKKFTTTGANERVAEYTGLSKEAVEAALRSAEAQYGEAEAIEYASKALAEKSGKNADEIKSVLQFAKNAEDAATKVKTFSQLWDVMKESAQSGWSQTWKILVGDFEKAKSFLTPLANTLTGFIGKISDARNRLLEGAMNFKSPWSSITKKLENSGLTKIAKSIDKVTGKLENFQKVVNDVWMGKYATSSTGRYDMLTEAGYNPKVVQELVNKGLDYKLTIDDVRAAHEKFGVAMSESAETAKGLKGAYSESAESATGLKAVIKDTSDATTDASNAILELTDEQLRNAGFTEDEITLYRALAKEAERTGKSVAELAKEMSEADGRTMLMDSFKNAGSGLIGIFTALKNAWTEIFPPVTVVQLYNIIKAVNTFSEKLRLTNKETGELTDTAKKIQRVFKGVFAVLDIVRQVFVALFNAIKPVFGIAGDLGGGFLDLAANLGDALVKFNEFIKSSNVLNTTGKVIAATIAVVYEGIKNLLAVVKEKFVAPGLEVLSSLIDRIRERMGLIGSSAGDMSYGVVDAFNAMNSALAECDFFKLLQTLWNAVTRIGAGIANAFGALASTLTDKLGNADFSGIFDFINSLSLSGIAIFVAKFVKGFSDITDSVGDFKESVIGILDEVKGCFEAYQTQLKAGTLIKIASAIAILAASILVISLIDSAKLSASLGAITVLFADLLGSMAIFGKVSEGISGVFKACTAMIGMSIAVLILASALKKIGELDADQMSNGVIGIMGLTATLVAAAIILGEYGQETIKGAFQMILFAAAIKILASVCTDLSTLSWDELVKGLVGVCVLLTAVSLFLSKTTFSDKAISTAIGIVILSSALKILTSACSDFGDMSWDEIKKGLTGIGILLLELAAFAKFTGNATNMISTGIALVAIGAAMKIFASAMKDISGMSWDEINKGLLGMAGALVAVTIAVNYMPKDIIGIGIGLIAVSTALVILANALTTMGNMTIDSVVKSLVMLGGSMFVLSKGLMSMTGSLAGSAALLVAAAAVAILTPTLIALGGMSWGAIVKGLVTIAGAFGVLGIAGALLGPLVPTILGLAASFALIGVGVVAVGAGLMLAGAGLSALAIGFTALATAVATGATAIVAGLTVIVTGLANLIPLVITKIGEGIIALCSVIAEGVPAIGEAIKAIVLTIVDVLVECVPDIADGALKLVVGVLAALVEYTPQIVGYLFDFFIGVLDSLAERIPELIQKGFDVVMSVFSGIIDALQGMDVSTLIKGIAGVGLMAGIMFALSSVAALVPGAMVGILGIGAVIAEMALVLGAIGILAQLPGLDWLINEGGQLLGSIGKAIGSFVGGLVGGIMGGIASALPEIGTHLSQFMINATPFIEGVKTIDGDSMLAGIGSLTAAILLLTAADVIAGITSFIPGGSSFAKLGIQLSQFMVNAMPFITSAKLIDPSVMTGVKSLADIILTLTQANILEGLTSWLTGGSSLTSFGEQLPKLGSYISLFAGNLGNFDESKVSTINCAADAIKAIANAASELPNEGGWAAKIFGDNSIAAFGSKLPQLGTDLGLFANNLGTFDETKVATVTCAANAIKAIANAASELPNEGGWAAKIFGDNSLSTFGDHLADLGSSLSEFAKELGTFDESKVQTVGSAVKAINAIASLAECDLKAATKNLGDFGDKIIGFASDISSFCTKMPAKVSIATAIDSMNDVLTMIKDIASVNVKAATDFTNSLKDLGKGGVNEFVNAFTNNTAKTDVKKAGAELIAQVIKGVESKKSDFNKAFTTAAKAAVDSIKSKTNYQSFYNAGSYLVSGFADGISENAYKATAKATAMAEAAAKAAREALNINSPSKVFMAIGSSIPEGFAIGIEKFTGMINGSSINMADVAIAGVKDSLSRVADFINSDIDAQPTIRPVIDLSDVEAGAKSVNSLFDTNASIGVLANVGTISSMMNSSQNGTDDGVISAIRELRDSFNGLSGDTYNINGITYDDDSAVSEAIKTIVRAAKTGRRV